MTEDEAKKELHSLIHKKVDELTYACYQGDMVGFVGMVINKDGQLQLMEAFNNQQMAHIYMMAGILQRRIEATLAAGSQPMKPRE